VGIPETYAARYGQWLKKHPVVIAAIESEPDEREIRQLQMNIHEIDMKIEHCRQLLGLDKRRLPNSSKRNEKTCE
jgi:phage terminase small subunit